MTIHVTPETGFSYVSFETNVAQSCYQDVINRVLDCFQPGKVLITVFANKVARKCSGCSVKGVCKSCVCVNK